MSTTVTVRDSDRRLDITLAVDYAFRPPVAARAGWNDGGSCGDPAAIELERARCLEIEIWFGPCSMTVRPEQCPGDRLEKRVGTWCLDEYAAEIEEEIWKSVRQRRPKLLI